mmetsp:Transcript_2973/g.6537  ORF Transcript_2973/g.6537 Transcript_2973/m.6537 type:complete len:230 (+) Transcript_2973:393-1082(+)
MQGVQVPCSCPQLPLLAKPARRTCSISPTAAAAVLQFVTATSTSMSVGVELCRELTLVTSDSLPTRRSMRAGGEVDRFWSRVTLGAQVTPGLAGAGRTHVSRGGHDEQRLLLSSSVSKSMKVRFTVRPKARGGAAQLSLPLLQPAPPPCCWLAGVAMSADPTAIVAISCPGLPQEGGATKSSCRSGCWSDSATRPPDCSRVGATLRTFSGCIFSTMRLSDPGRRSPAAM